MNKRKQIIFSVAAVLLLVLLTIGVTYAVFTYTKLGTTENTVTAGTLKFLYTENTGVGAGIKLEDALPVSDTVGKGYSTEGFVFDFSIEATNTGTEAIPYEITLRKKDTSTLGEEAVKVYLTDMTEDADSELLAPTLYKDLTQTLVDVGEEIEKTIHTDNVTGGELTYLKDYRLRMWVDENTDFSTGNYNGKTFIATVNVYSNVPLVSEEEINLRENTEINEMTLGNIQVAKVENEEYDYETSLPEGTTETTINVETTNPNAKVEIEKLDSLTYSSNTKKIAVTKTLSLTNGDNYFKVTVLSENKKVEDEYILKIYVGQTNLLTQAIFNKYKTIYENPTLTDSSNNTNDASGLYKSTETNSGKPTYYFRGAVNNNYVSFAGKIWRIVRINEDGTIRMIMEDGINNNATYKYNPKYTGYTYMYYSNSNVENGAKYILDNWYQTNIVDKGYSNYVATGDYYCEQAKVKMPEYSSGNATMTSYSDYTPNFECKDDGNEFGIVNGNIGLLTYDEVAHAGGYYNKNNDSYYLYNGSINWWTMSPAGLRSGFTDAWIVYSNGYLERRDTDNLNCLLPVINLKSNTTIEGLGTSDSPWEVQ